MNEKPPLGVVPKYIHDDTRLDELRFAIMRYAEARRQISLDWIDEYNTIVRERKQ
jgi:hypothetical protein